MNILDGNLTKSHKTAKRFNIPDSYVIVNQDGTTQNLIKYVTKLISRPDSNIKRVVHDLGKCGKYQVTVEQIVFLYHSITENYESTSANRILIRHGINPFEDMEDYMERRDRWLKIFNTAKLHNVMTVSHIVSIQEKLLRLTPPSDRFSIKYNKSTTVYRAMPQSDVPIDWDITSIYDIVDNVIMSHNTPFVQSPNNDKGHIYKLFFSEDSVEVYDHNNFIFFSHDKFSYNKIYLYIWNGKNINSKNSYSECIYDTATGIMEVTVSSRDIPIEESIFQTVSHLQESLPFFRLVEGGSKSVNAEITYQDVSLNLDILYFMIDQDYVMSNYLCISERTNLRTTNKNPLLVFNNIINTDYSITIKLSHFMDNSNINLLVSVNGATSDMELNEVAVVMNHLIARYFEIYPNYQEYIIAKVGEIPEGDVLKYNFPTTKNMALSAQFPEVFGSADEKSGYAISCQKPLQPIIIDDDEIDSWRKMLINGKPRQIAEYPPPRLGVKKLFNYVCPDDTKPWPSLKPNKYTTAFGEDGEVSHTMVPCCCLTNRYDQYLKDGTGTFAKYYSMKIKTVKEKIFKTFKPVKEGNMGILPSVVKTHLDMSADIEEYVSNITNRGYSVEEDEEIEKECDDDNNQEETDDVKTSMYMHYSLGYTPDSLIRCVLYAMDLPPDNAPSIRSQMASLSDALYAQENISGTSEILSNKILNGYIDPKLFYRGLEELFDINIYMFDATTNLLITPYNKVTYIKHIRLDKPCVLIWYHPVHKISELIIKLRENDPKKKNKIKVFGKDMVSRMHEVLNISYVSYGGITYKNVFNVTDWQHTFSLQKELGISLVSQKLDSNGKCRGFMLYSPGLSNKYLTFYTIPTQPLNINTELFDNYYVTADEAIRYVGKDPYSKIDNDGVSGLWFSFLGVLEYMFVLVSDVSEFDISISTETSPYTTNDELIGQIDRQSDTKKISLLLPELIWWTFSTEHRKVPSVASFRQWWKTNVVIDDSVTLDEFVSVQKLKDFNNSRDSIEFLSHYYPSIFNISIRLPGKLHCSLKNFFVQSVRESEGLDIVVHSSLTKKYAREKDFNSEGNKIFLSQNGLETWVKSASNVIKDLRFITDIDQLDGSHISLYKNDSNMYIVQKEKNIKRAVGNSAQFRKTQINLVDQKVELEVDYPYITYVMFNQKLYIQSIMGTIGEVYGEVLEHGDNIYSLLSF